jgi:hypothetical protein
MMQTNMEQQNNDQSQATQGWSHFQS